MIKEAPIGTYVEEVDGEVLATVLVVDELDFGAASLGHLLLLGVLAHSERHSTCAPPPHREKR